MGHNQQALPLFGESSHDRWMATPKLPSKAWKFLGDISLVQWLGSLLPIAWTPIVSALTATGAAYWAWSDSLGNLPTALIALGVFVSTIWGLNGVIWLKRQAAPSREQLAFSSIWGVSIDNIYTSLDLGNEVNRFELRPLVRNATNGPIRLGLKRLFVSFGDRYAEATLSETYLPMHTNRTIFMNRGFSAEAWDALPERTVGRMEVIIEYGHPSAQYSRVYEAEIELNIRKYTDASGPSVSLNWSMLKDSDNPHG